MPALAARSMITCTLQQQQPHCRRAATRAPALALHNHAVGPAQEEPVVTAVQPSTRVLPLMSDLLAAEALTRRFEQLAGRAAMVGASVAVCLELALPSAGGVFGALGGDAGGDATQLAAAAIFALCCSVGLAARTSSRPLVRHRLLEPLLASLTSQRRSFAGVTQSNVDRAVDYLLETVFTAPFLSAHFPDDEDKYI